MSTHQRSGLSNEGCTASNAIKGKQERDAYGHCALCGDGAELRRATPPAVTAKPEQPQPPSDWKEVVDDLEEAYAHDSALDFMDRAAKIIRSMCASPRLAAPVEQASRSIAPKSASGRLLPGADKFVDLMHAWRFANVGAESERTFAAVVAHVDQWAASIPPLQAPEPAPESVRDAVRIEHLERWNADNKAEGFHWNTFAFDSGKTIREQIDADMAAQEKAQ